jgi:hypothetical protein
MRTAASGIDWGVYGVPETFVVSTRTASSATSRSGRSPSRRCEQKILPLVRELQKA